MSQAGPKNVEDFSDTELLDALEQLIQHPEFLNLELGYEHDVRKFYAGCEYGRDLRDLLRTILTHNRPGSLTLEQLTRANHETKSDAIPEADRDPPTFHIDAA